MASRNPAGSKPVASAAEQRMRSWALGVEVRDRLEQSAAVAELPTQLHNYVALSREAGAGGGEIAQRVGALLGWQVLDKELVDYMAEHYQLPRDLLDFVDEHTSNWVHEVFGKWLDSHLVTQSEYVGHLGRILLMAARHGSSVFVGRGAQFLLPRDRGLAVRIIAPLEQRLRAMMRRHEVGHDQAAKMVKSIDAGRNEFVQRYFQHNAAYPHLYDLVINLKYTDVESAAELIADQCRKRTSV